MINFVKKWLKHMKNTHKIGKLYTIYVCAFYVQISQLSERFSLCLSLFLMKLFDTCRYRNLAKVTGNRRRFWPAI